MALQCKTRTVPGKLDALVTLYVIAPSKYCKALESEVLLHRCCINFKKSFNGESAEGGKKHGER